MDSGKKGKKFWIIAEVPFIHRSRDSVKKELALNVQRSAAQRDGDGHLMGAYHG
jgi:hypothetical protein